MTQRYDEGYWRHHGLQIGRELATIDRTTGLHRSAAELPPVLRAMSAAAAEAEASA